MKKFILSMLVWIFCISFSNAQQFISISPDFSTSNQTISTIVTGSNFYFTIGSSPSTWGDFYMIQNTQQIFPTNVSVIDDDHLDVTWYIPSGVPSGNYVVQWNLDMLNFYYYDVPGGFNINCVPPPAVISNPVYNYLCAGSNIILTANTGTGYLYQWYKNDVLISGATNSTYSATTAGNYHVRVSNAQGCPRYSAKVAVYQINPPVSTIISPATNTAICPGSSITLTANSGANLTYQWFKNGNAINTATSISYTTADTGSYSVRVTNYYGCTNLSSTRIISAAPVPASYVTALGPLTFCNGSSVTLKTSSGSGYTYQWYKYGNPIAGAVNQTLVATTSGTYKVQVTNSNGCTKKSGTKTVNVLPLPNAVITPVGSTTICAGDSVRLNANTGSGYTYYWKKYGNIINGAASSYYYAKNAGPYKVVVTGSNGCSKVSAAVNVSVITCREFLPGSEQPVSIYPNPAYNELNVIGSEIYKVEISTIEGKTVYTSLEKGTQNIDISQLQAGLYFVIIYSGNEIVTKRLEKLNY